MNGRVTRRELKSPIGIPEAEPSPLSEAEEEAVWSLTENEALALLHIRIRCKKALELLEQAKDVARKMEGVKRKSKTADDLYGWFRMRNQKYQLEKEAVVLVASCYNPNPRRHHKEPSLIGKTSLSELRASFIHPSGLHLKYPVKARFEGDPIGAEKPAPVRLMIAEEGWNKTLDRFSLRELCCDEEDIKLVREEVRRVESEAIPGAKIWLGDTSLYVIDKAAVTFTDVWTYRNTEDTT